MTDTRERLAELLAWLTQARILADRYERFGDTLMDALVRGRQASGTTLWLAEAVTCLRALGAADPSLFAPDPATVALEGIARRTARMGLCSQTHHEHLAQDAANLIKNASLPSPDRDRLAALVKRLIGHIPIRDGSEGPSYCHRTGCEWRYEGEAWADDYAAFHAALGDPSGDRS